MMRLGRYGLRVGVDFANFSRKLSVDTKDPSSRLATTIFNSTNVNSGEADKEHPSSLSAKRITPFSQPYAQITEEEFKKAAVKVDSISRSIILGKGVFEKMKQSFSIEPKESSAYLVGGFYSWAKSGCQRVNIKEDGSIILLNSDKRALITQFASLIDSGIITPGKHVLLLNEGCDNGDFLGLMIPFLSNCGSELKVVLVNGNEKKLQEAALLSRSLLEDQDVTYLVHDSFSSIPSIVGEFSNYQTLHLFFRLPIVERFSVVADFTQKRLDSMKPSDVAIGSYLLWDDISMETMTSRYANKTKEVNQDLGYIILEQEPTKSAKKNLIASGAKEEDLNIYTTAFTEDGVSDLITSRGGEILQMTMIPTQTDGKHDINVMGVIFKKRSK